MRGKISKKRIAIIFVFVFALTIGFALLNASLNITGSAALDPHTWSVYWTMVGGDISSGTTVIAEPTFDGDNTTVTDSFSFAKPGDWGELIVDAVNDGSLDVMIDTITVLTDGEEMIPDYLTTELTYMDGVPLLPKQKINAHTSQRYRVFVAYKKDLNNDDLPDDNQTVTLTLSVKYVQADRTAKEIKYLYTVDDSTVISTFEPMPDNVFVYTSASAAMSDFGHPVCLKHALMGKEVIFSTIVGEYESNLVGLNHGFNGYQRNKDLFSNLYASYECVEDRLHETETYLAPTQGHYTYSCASESLGWEVDFDSQSRAFMISKDEMGCTILDEKSICGNIFSNATALGFM